MGTKLKIASPKFTRIIEETIDVKLAETPLFSEKRRIIPKKIAIKRLASIPAAATAMVPHFLLLRFSEL